MMKNSSTCMSGKSVAKEKNIDRYTYSAVICTFLPKRYIRKPYRIVRIKPEKK